MGAGFTGNMTKSLIYVATCCQSATWKNLWILRQHVANGNNNMIYFQCCHNFHQTLFDNISKTFEICGNMLSFGNIFMIVFNVATIFIKPSLATFSKLVSFAATCCQWQQFYDFWIFSNTSQHVAIGNMLPVNPAPLYAIKFMG